MKIQLLVCCAGLTLGLTGLSAVAQAQNNTNANGNANGTVSGQAQVSVGMNGAPIAAPRSDNDPQPMVSGPALPRGGLIRQAGVGGTTGYARAGVLELGGSLSVNIAGGLRQFTIAPSIGWFFTDNIEISAILNVNYASTITSGVRTSGSSFSILAEPSYHLPLSRTLFAFLGVGMGVAYADGPGAGFALAPRLGMNLMVGRSGVFTPALQFLYSTSDVIQTSQGTLIAGNTSFGFNAGYTVMW